MDKPIRSKEELIEMVSEMLSTTVELDEIISELSSQMITMEEDNKMLTIENRMLKEQLAFEQRKNQRDANRRG